MQNVQELYSTSISQMPPSERLKLAMMILTNRSLTNGENKSDQRQSVRQMVREMPAGRIFKTSAEADSYLEQERDSWDR